MQKEIYDCKCNEEYKGVYCHFKDGCKWESDIKKLEDTLDEIFKNIPCEDCQETGSKYICNPPVLNTDEDWIFDCSAEGQMEAADKFLKIHDFFMCDMAEDEYDDIRANFTPYRLGYMNFILCNNKSFYKKFVFATELAADMNLLDKDNRIRLFQAILYNKINGEEYPL